MSKTVFIAVLAAAMSLGFLPAFAASKKGGAGCPGGKVKAHGACVDACPTDKAFDPTTCECPAGFGKILSGAGTGECRRLACPTGAAIKNPALCDCPTGYEKKKGPKGETRCLLARTDAPAHAK